MIRGTITKPNYFKPLNANKQSSPYYIVKNNGLLALPGDIVEAELLKPNFGSNQLPCCLTKIVKRSRTLYIGIVSNVKPFQVVLLNHDIVFSLQFTSWPISSELKPGKQIVVNLGLTWADYVCDVGCYTTDEIIAKVFQLEHNQCPVPSPLQIDDSKTLDLTDLYTFTVDSAKSTDLDDALSIDSVNHKIYVHITDVSRYVPMYSPLDQRLLERQTSYYLSGTVFHMNPAEIVNLCSLDPNQTRYAVSFVLPYDPVTNLIDYGKITHTRSKITSKKRYTYEEANTSDHPDLTLLHKLFIVNRKPKMISNVTDDISLVTKSPNKTLFLFAEDDWNLCIEYYMVTVNSYVSETCYKAFVPCIHRKHPEPNYPDSFMEAKNLNLDHNVYPPELSLLLCILQLALSYYSPSEVGHFGLNKTFYTHATSPLRRYVDLVVQRILVGDARYNAKQLELVCELANKSRTKRNQIGETEIILADLKIRKVGQRVKGILTSIKRTHCNVYLIDQTKIVSVDIPVGLCMKTLSFVELEVSETFHKVVYKIVKSEN